MKKMIGLIALLILMMGLVGCNRETVNIDFPFEVRDVENIVKGFELQEARKNKPKVEKSKEYQYVEGLLRKKYRTRIKVDDKSITIKYSDTDDLNRLLELMGVIEES